MSWRVVATVFIVVFAALLVLSFTADPLVQVGNAFSDVGDSGGEFDVPALISGWVGAYFNMFLVLVFGIIAWGAWRILRREVTRGQL